MTEKRPFDILNSALNNRVLVGLKGGVELSGTMASYDVHMNIVLEKTQLVKGTETRGIGTVLVRGDSVVYISPSQA